VPADLLQGTLDLLVLKALQLEPMHGWGITERIEQWSNDVLQINQGSLYPALHRLTRQGFITSSWRTTENNRRARYYSLTAAGQRYLTRELESWHLRIASVGGIVAICSGAASCVRRRLRHLGALALARALGSGLRGSK